MSLEKILTVYHPERIQYEKLESEKAQKALLTALEFSASWDVQGIMIDAGTLLGLVRDGGFIQHDTDIDIAVLTTRDQIRSFRNPIFPVSRSVHVGELPMQIAYLDNGILVDFYFYYLTSDGEYYINANSKCVLKLPKNLIHPIKQKNFGVLKKIPIPSYVEDYLEWTYGKYWAIPKQTKTNWVKDRPNLCQINDIENSILSALEFRLLVENEALSIDLNLLRKSHQECQEEFRRVLESKSWKYTAILRNSKKIAKRLINFIVRHKKIEETQISKN